MKTKILLTCLILTVASVAFAQDYDTAKSNVHYGEYDTVYRADDLQGIDSISNDSVDYSEEYFVGKPNPNATYTINDPSQLPVTKDNNAVPTVKNDFDKEKWKEIVGETTFNQEKEKEEEKERSSTPAWSGAVLRVVAYGSIFIIVIVVFYFLIRNAFAEEVRNKKKNEGGAPLFDEHIDEVSELDIEALLKQALATGDFKSAARLYYIRLLKHLHDTKFIVWKKDKTNRDYSYELSKTPLIQGFQKITLAYEIIWYGEHTPTAEEFKVLQRNLTEFQNLTTSATS